MGSLRSASTAAPGSATCRASRSAPTTAPPSRTAARRLLDDLDGVPFARRYRRHDRHMNVPFIPIIGGRLAAGARPLQATARSSPSTTTPSRPAAAARCGSAARPNVATDEMALLLEAAGGQGDLLLPRRQLRLPEREASRSSACGGDPGGARRLRRRPGGAGRQGPPRLRDPGARPRARRPRRHPPLRRRRERLRGRGRPPPAGHAARSTSAGRSRRAARPTASSSATTCSSSSRRRRSPTCARTCASSATTPTTPSTSAAPSRTSAPPCTPTSPRSRTSAAATSASTTASPTRAPSCSSASARPPSRERNFAPNGVANRYMGLGYAANILRRFHGDGRRHRAPRPPRPRAHPPHLARHRGATSSAPSTSPSGPCSTTARPSSARRRSSASRSPPPIGAGTRSSTSCSAT